MRGLLKGLAGRVVKRYQGMSIQMVLSLSFTAVALVGVVFMGGSLLLRFSDSARNLSQQATRRVLAQVNLNLDSYLRRMMRVSDTMYYRVIKNTDLASDTLDEEMGLLYEENRDGTGNPYFSFNVTYQGHGPYGDRECWWGEPEDFFTNPGLDDASRYILSNYLGSVMATQRHLADMVDAFRASDEPIVLVVFGDHKPWLGNGNSVYHALGVTLDQDSQEGFYNYWSTPYLIWANGAAKAALGRDVRGKGPDISPCFLMNVLFEQLGWTGDAYMQAVDPCRAELPVIHSPGARLTAAGELTAQLPPEQKELARRFLCLSYYRAHQLER